MFKLKSFGLVLAMMLCASLAFAQNEKVTGTVTDPNGEPMVGVFVMIQGTTTGVSTDIDGKYTINAPVNGTLEFSVMGMQTAVVPVNNKSVIDVKMAEDAVLLDDVVVTAMGMKREKKALTYAVQDVKGSSLIENRTDNVVSSLSGKIAGMTVTGTSVPGGSNRIVIRGESSLNNNQPLVVVDGVPFDNTQGCDDTNGMAWGGYDYGDGMSMLNPDDIESISVLKGPSAAALYGSRGGAGVILVTTKSGKKGTKPMVNFNSNFTFENVALQPNFQNEYGQGTAGAWDQSSRVSWGPKMGTSVPYWKTKGLTNAPMEAKGNNFSSFMETGYSLTNSLDVSGGTEKSTYRFGVSNMRQNGVIPNNGIYKTNLSARVSTEILPKLTAEVKIQYANQKGKNRPALSVSSYNPIFALIYTPRSINLRDMEPLFNEDGQILDWYENMTGSKLSTIQNPWAITNLTGNTDRTNRVTAHGSLKYEILPWLDIKGQYGIDTYSVHKDRWIRHGLTSGTPDGAYYVNTQNFTEVNADFLLSAHKDNFLGSKFNLSGSFGGNIMHRNSRATSESATGLNIPELYTISNGMTIAASSSTSEKEIQSIYGMFHAEYDGYVFLDVTARNDWSSTLPKNKWSYFYPSVSAGLVVTEMLNKLNVNVPTWWTYAKVRAAYAQVGKDTSPYELYPVMSTSANQAGGQMIATLPGTRPNAELKPERQSGYELGLESRFFDGRFGFDFTWYDQTTKDQIISLPTSITSGYTAKLVNAGKIQNKGIELVVDVIPIETKEWNWKLSFNYTKNWSKVKELAEGMDTYVLANPMGQNIEVVARVGEPYGEILTNDIKVNEKGEKLVGDNGKYVVDATRTSHGNMNPDWMGSISSSLSYKGFDFNFHIDARIGGKMYLQSMMRLESNGQVNTTLPGRAEYYATGKGLISEGVNVNTGLPNTVELDPTTYYGQFYGNQGHYMYSTTNVRMREMSLGYTFPKRWFNGTIISNLKLSVVGTNLFFFYNDLPGYDPECTYSTGTAQGVETCALPSTRRFGFNLNVTF